MGKVDKFIDEENWGDWVGKKIIKHSNRPFKNGEKIGIPLSLCVNPNSGKKAFLMSEDFTNVVDCHQCKLLK